MYKRPIVTASIIALVLILGMGTVSAAVRTVTLRVKGMTCGGCAATVEKALKSTAGIEDARVSFGRRPCRHQI